MMQSGLPNIFQNERTILIVIMLLALVNGLFYVFIVPPWQHYDEPNHFEYLWLLTERDGRPEPGDYDSDMRREVAQSMIENGFFGDQMEIPDLTSEKPWIGQYSQLDEPPLYYLLASIPIRLLSIENVDFQLYTARLVSMALFLITIFAGYGLMTEIMPVRHPLRYLVPLTLALLPAFADLMTAVNNDVGAITFFSLFLWGCVRLIHRIPSWPTLLWVLATCALCLVTKRTVFLAIPLLGIALLFAFLRGNFRKLAWGLVFVLGIAIVLAIFSWGDAALWYRDTPQNFATRSSIPEMPEGRMAFRLVLQPGKTDVKLVQLIPPDIASQLSGTPLTLGAWIWASQPIEIQSPQLRIYDGAQTYEEMIHVTEKPQFFALDSIPQGDTRRAWVALEPSRDIAPLNPVEIYFDGVVLAAGLYPINQAPIFDPGGSSGTWGGIPFENLLRNASAERGWFYLRPWADKIGSRFFSDYEGQESFSLTVYSLADLQVTSGYYQVVLTNLFRTFWAKFGWAHVPLLGNKPYAWILLPVTVLACAGVALNFWQRRHRLGKLPWDVLFIFGLTLLSLWGVTLVRGTTYLLTRIYVPVSRYAYPAIIPTVLFLSTGWFTLLKTSSRWLRFPGWVKYVVYVGFFLLLNLYALLSITRFYG